MKPYIKNTIMLTICIIISKVIGAVYKILLSNTLGTQGIGLYQLVFPVYSLFLVFVTGGMPTYIAQKISVYRATNSSEKISSLIKNAILLCLVLGILFCLLLSLFGFSFATLQGNQMAYLGYITVAVSIVFSVVTCVFRGYFMGQENMKPNAISGVFEQLSKLGFGLVLSMILKQYGLIFAVCGAFLGVLSSEIISFLYMYFAYIKWHKKVRVFFDYRECKSIFKGFLPVTMASFVLPLSACVDSFLVVNLLMRTGVTRVGATSLFGIATGMVNPLVNFPVILCGAIATAFLPSLAYSVAKKQDTNKLIANTYFFVWLICLPCAFGVFAVAPTLINVCYPSIEIEFFDVSVFYLCLSAFNIIWLSVSQISTSVLNGLGKFYLPLVSQIVGFVFKIVLFVLLVLLTKLNILSLAIASVASNSISCIILLGLVKKHTVFSLKMSSLIVPFVSSIFMAGSVFVFSKFFKFSSFFSLAFLVGFGVAVYFLICLVFKVISFADIKNLFGKNAKSNLSWFCCIFFVNYTHEDRRYRSR